MLKKHTCKGVVAITLCTIMTGIEASLDLLAGVEAGIDTATAMAVSDLEQTQKILSSQAIGTHHQWLNDETGTAYEIIIDNHYSYGTLPCLAYKLVINRGSHNETKSLNACKNVHHRWISISSGTTAL